MPNLPASGPISLNDINTRFRTSGRNISMGDPETRYLLESGTYNAGFMPLPDASTVDLAAGYNKPSFSAKSSFYGTPGNWTFYMPVYKTITIDIVGGGGGEGGTGCTIRDCNTVINAGCNTCSGCCSGSCTPSGVFCVGFPFFLQFNVCNQENFTTYTGNTGNTGGTTSVRISGALISQATGGTGGTGGSNVANGTNGSPGAGSFGPGYTGTTSTYANGGGGLTNGGDGGNGGFARVIFTYDQTTNYPRWANSSGVITLSLVVGSGGTGGSGNANCSPRTTGANGGNGIVNIYWD